MRANIYPLAPFGLTGKEIQLLLWWTLLWSPSQLLSVADLRRKSRLGSPPRSPCGEDAVAVKQEGEGATVGGSGGDPLSSDPLSSDALGSRASQLLQGFSKAVLGADALDKCVAWCRMAWSMGGTCVLGMF
jgi:hypothetical protein